jgi:hypothetical protein
MKRRVLGVLAAALGLLLCSCATKLINTSVDYRRVTPEKARPVWTCVPRISTNAPVLLATLTTEGGYRQR